MWLFTPYGFFSVSAVNGATVAIRARSIAHLRALIARFPGLLTQHIVRTPNRDYLYRITVRKSEWVAVAGALAAELGWSNFKDEASRRRGKADPSYIAVLHQIWSVMFRYQGDVNRPKRKAQQCQIGW